MRPAIPALALALAVGCGGRGEKKRDDPLVGELLVQFLLPEGFDPDEDVESWRVTVRDAEDGDVVVTATIPAGDPLRLDALEPADAVYVELESVGAQASVLGRGRTETLSLGYEATETTLYFAPPRSLFEVDGTEAGNAFAAVLPLSDGRVLIAGGLEGDLDGAPDTQLFEPRRNTLTDLTDVPAEHRLPAVFSPAPDVLVLAGGAGADGLALDATSIFVWDAGSGTGAWTAGSPLGTARAEAAAAALGGGRALLVGGTNGDGFLATTETFDWNGTQGTWTDGPADRPRASASVVPLSGGRALILGGRDDTGFAMGDVDLFVPDGGGDSIDSAPGDNLDSSRSYAAVVPLSATSWLLAGGLNASGELRDAAEVLSWDDALSVAVASQVPDVPTPRRRGGGGTTADGRVVLCGADVSEGGPLDVLPLEEPLEFVSGSFVPFDPSPGATASCTIVPLADGTSLVVTDGDVLRYNP